MSKDVKTAEQHAKGSIVLEILAVILAGLLIFTLTYPAKLWKAEEINTKICRENMQHIYYAELTYLDNFLVYTDTLEKAVNYILSDPSGKALRRFANLDSILGQQIIKKFKKMQDLVFITIDSVDSINGAPPEYLVKRGKHIPVSSLIDSMLIFTRAFSIDTSEAYIMDSLRRASPAFAAKIDSMARAKLENLNTCPTNHKPYNIYVNNDSAIKVIKVSCPIDTAYMESINKSFKYGFLGGLKIENHGNIELGKESWKE
ncbi:MAG: hypothetical protein ONB12_02280 [candidate division KSB1 bacterium]|nr:hypothetical protein [candidate division KSB1 bacterium]